MAAMNSSAFSEPISFLISSPRSRLTSVCIFAVSSNQPVILSTMLLAAITILAVSSAASLISFFFSLSLMAFFMGSFLSPSLSMSKKSGLASATDSADLLSSFPLVTVYTPAACMNFS